MEQLTPYGTHISEPQNLGKAMLNLALEPECAALSVCKLQGPVDIADYADRCDDRANKNYLVFDIGGGTVDITVLKHISHADSYETVIPPKGCEYGGMKVNENFSKFLQKVVKDEGFSKFLSNRQTKNGHKVRLLSMINGAFDKLKVEFGDEANYPGLVEQADEKFSLILDRKFVEFYKQAIPKGLKGLNDPRVTFSMENYVLEFTYSKMAEFFEPVLQGITECVVLSLKSVDMEAIDLVYVAGGFGGCKYVFNHLKTVVSCYYGAASRKVYNFIVPKYHTIAVSRGGVHYCQQPDIITARIMDASYGIGIVVPFEEEVHEEQKAVYNEENVKFCDKIFHPFVRKGDKVKLHELFSIKTTPLLQDQTTAEFEFYRTDLDDVKYVDEKGVKSIGKLKLDLETDRYGTVPNDGRQLKISVCFSSTEIIAHAQALYLPGEPTVKAFLDFL